MNHQTGGVDPGLAALIASLLSGGIGAYGFSKESRSAGDEATERLRGEYESKLKEAENIKNQAAEVSQNSQKIAQLEAERERLQQELESLKGDAERNSGPAIAFRNATPDTLRAAVPIVLTKLSVNYPWIKSDGSSTPLLRSALEYPATYSARLLRMTLPDFYQKRVLKAAETDYQTLPKGGRSRRYRRRARRGGQTMEDELRALESAPTEPLVAQVPGVSPEPGSAASYSASSFSFPSAQEFAQIYSEAIAEAGTGAIKAEIQQKPTDKAQAKKDATAVKAANTLADKLEKAIKTAKAEIAKVTDPEFIERIKEETGDFIHSDLDGSPGVADLRAVKTETEWNDINEWVSTRLESITNATKQLVDLVKAEKKASKNVPKPPAPAPAVPEPAAPAPEPAAPPKGTSAWTAWFTKKVPEKAPKAKNSDTIHQELLKRPTQMISELKARTKKFKATWDTAKSARDSLCTSGSGLVDYKLGPETYEKITLKMQEGDKLLTTSNQIQSELESFTRDYKEATRDISFVADSSFTLSPTEERAKIEADQSRLAELSAEYNRPLKEEELLASAITPQQKEAVRLLYLTPEEEAAKKKATEEKLAALRAKLEAAKAAADAPAVEGAQTGGAFSDLLRLRERFDELDSRAWTLYKDMDALEVSLKKTTAKLVGIDDTGPMTPEQRAEEDKERAIRAEFRKSPLPLECSPYNYIPPPPPSVGPPKEKATERVKGLFNRFKTVIPSVQKEVVAPDSPVLSTTPNTSNPASVSSSPALGPALPPNLPNVKMFRSPKVTLKKRTNIDLSGGKLRKSTLKKRRGGK